MALFDQKKLPDAVVAYRKAIDCDPKDANAYNSLGSALIHQRKLPDAIAACQQAIKLDPKHAIAHHNLALALVKLNDPKKLPEALAAAEKAIELDPKYADAYDVRGTVLSAQNKLDDAIAAHQKAIELNPKHPHAYTNLATDFGRQGKFDRAIDCCRKALAINSKNISAYDTLGTCQLKQRKWDEAINYFRKGLEIDRNDVSIRNKLASALNEKGWEIIRSPNPKLPDPKRAVERAKEAVELAPQRSDCWQGLGWIHYRAGNWKDSIEALEKSCALQDDPKGGDAAQWFFLAMAHRRLGEKEQAREWYDRAVGWMDKHAPNDADLRRFRAEAAELLELKEKK
jgi:superkiller protein 3